MIFWQPSYALCSSVLQVSAYVKTFHATVCSYYAISHYTVTVYSECKVTDSSCHIFTHAQFSFQHWYNIIHTWPTCPLSLPAEWPPLQDVWQSHHCTKTGSFPGEDITEDITKILSAFFHVLFSIHLIKRGPSFKLKVIVGQNYYIAVILCSQ